ncbi:hypothetical protein [Runella sp.]|uniref:hypothetical protein n=1 Tax=Runella sp. TaxID=1960881 RepID=UPI003D115427
MNKNQAIFATVSILILLFLLFRRANKASRVTGKFYAKADDVTGFAVEKNANGQWNPLFDNVVKVYKKGELISTALVGSLTTVNAEMQTFKFLILEVSWWLGIPVNICIEERLITSVIP